MHTYLVMQDIMLPLIKLRLCSCARTELVPQMVVSGNGGVGHYTPMQDTMLLLIKLRLRTSPRPRVMVQESSFKWWSGDGAGSNGL